MRKKGFFRSLTSIPTEPKDIFPWLIKHALLSGGGLALLGWGVLALAALSLFGFMIGDFTDNGGGNVINGQIQLGASTAAENHAVMKMDEQVASSWQKGLSQNQISQVEQVNGGLPAGVLLAVGKVINGLSNPQPNKYYPYLAPKFQWKTVTETTTTYTNINQSSGNGNNSNGANSTLFQGTDYKKSDSGLFKNVMFIGSGGETRPPEPVQPSSGQGKAPSSKSSSSSSSGSSSYTYTNGQSGNKVTRGTSGPMCVPQTTTKKVKLLTSVVTWDGSIAISYKKVDTGTKGCSSSKVSTYSQTYEETAVHQTLGDWSRVWALFKNIKTSSETYFQDTKENEQYVAGLIGAVDYTVMDPEVQTMVAHVLNFTSAGAGVPVNVHVAPAGSSTIKNVERWTPYIEKFAQQYNVPPLLIAGVMCQESGGTQYWTSGPHKGEVKNSGVGSGGIGALGLMQVEPTTAAGMTLNGQRIGSNAMADLSNPITNIEIGTEYLSELWHTFHNRAEAEAGYNAGGGREREALDGYRSVIEEGVEVPAISQTEHYVLDIEGSWIPALEGAFSSPSSIDTSNTSTM